MNFSRDDIVNAYNAAKAVDSEGLLFHRLTDILAKMILANETTADMHTITAKDQLAIHSLNLEGDHKMTFTLSQLQTVHAKVVDMASTPTDDPKMTAAHKQRNDIMNEVMGEMLVYGKKTLDRDELAPEVATLIERLLYYPERL